jgi:uncharacterized protein YdcH (DUF465 family)|tara:strand:- start:137 stop:322 length:186 start_codon:yes stop_codon:yes gene_type:complete
MTLSDLAERHRQLNEEVERLSQRKDLSIDEQKNLKNLKKLKLSYKDALYRAKQVNKISYDD